MISTPGRQAAVTLIKEAVNAGARRRRACAELGLSLRTFERWTEGGELHSDRRPGAVRREPANKLTAEERTAVLQCVSEPRFASLPPTQIVPRLADEGSYIASESSFYRILREKDLLASAVLERSGDAIRFNPELLALAAHYRFEPRPVAIARGNEKGRVERAIRYIRDAFFAARPFRDLKDLNTQADAWCETVALDRRLPGDPTLSVREAFGKERALLLALPENPYPAIERVAVKGGKA